MAEVALLPSREDEIVSGVADGTATSPFIIPGDELRLRGSKEHNRRNDKKQGRESQSEKEH